jgi:hypothetical protein
MAGFDGAEYSKAVFAEFVEFDEVAELADFCFAALLELMHAQPTEKSSFDHSKYQESISKL